MGCPVYWAPGNLTHLSSTQISHSRNGAMTHIGCEKLSALEIAVDLPFAHCRRCPCKMRLEPGAGEKARKLIHILTFRKKSRQSAQGRVQVVGSTALFTCISIWGKFRWQIPHALACIQCVIYALHCVIIVCCWNVVQVPAPVNRGQPYFATGVLVHNFWTCISLQC